VHRVVVDASVCLKWWFQDEPGSTKARSILKKIASGDVSLVVPHLWIYEVTNGIRSAVVRKRITEEMGRLFVDEAQVLGIHSIDVLEFVSYIFETALKLDVSAYDASYIVLAEKERIDFITGDEKLYNKVVSAKPFVKYFAEI